MKPTVLKSIQLSIITASLLTSCFALSSAYAYTKDVYLHAENLAYDTGLIYFFDQAGIDKLMQQYGHIGYGERSRRTPDRLRMVLHGSIDQPKWGAYTIGVIPKDEYGNDLPQEDLVLKSKKEALGLCENLTVHHPRIDYFPLAIDDLHYQRVIEVPYAIAYDRNSQEESNGTSTPARKYVMCRNYGGDQEWILDPTRTNENEAVGILSSQLNAGTYQVTCMPAAHKLPATFRLSGVTISNGVETYLVNPSNLTNLHQYNKFVGAQYCPQ